MACWENICKNKQCQTDLLVSWLVLAKVHSPVAAVFCLRMRLTRHNIVNAYIKHSVMKANGKTQSSSDHPAYPSVSIRNTQSTPITVAWRTACARDRVISVVYGLLTNLEVVSRSRNRSLAHYPLSSSAVVLASRRSVRSHGVEHICRASRTSAMDL